MGEDRKNRILASTLVVYPTTVTDCVKTVIEEFPNKSNVLNVYDMPNHASIAVPPIK